MSEYLTRDILDLIWNSGKERKDIMDRVYEIVKADRDTIRAEVRKEVTEEILKDAMIPDWKTHKGCSGARVVYEYGAFGDVAWDSKYNDKGSTIILKNGGYIKTGTWYDAPPPKTRPMTRKERINFCKENGYYPNLHFLWNDLKDDTIDDLLNVGEIPTEVHE